MLGKVSKTFQVGVVTIFLVGSCGVIHFYQIGFTGGTLGFDVALVGFFTNVCCMQCMMPKGLEELLSVEEKC